MSAARTPHSRGVLTPAAAYLRLPWWPASHPSRMRMRRWPAHDTAIAAHVVRLGEVVVHVAAPTLRTLRPTGDAPPLWTDDDETRWQDAVLTEVRAWEEQATAVVWDPGTPNEETEDLR